MLSFVPTYMQNDSMIEYNMQMGMQMKAQNYWMENQWQYQYSSGLPFGGNVYSGYPAGFDPVQSGTFNLGNPLLGSSRYYTGV